jgi:hypothetical protein
MLAIRTCLPVVTFAGLSNMRERSTVEVSVRAANWSAAGEECGRWGAG